MGGAGTAITRGLDRAGLASRKETGERRPDPSEGQLNALCHTTISIVTARVVPVTRWPEWLGSRATALWHKLRPLTGATLANTDGLDPSPGSVLSAYTKTG